MLESKILLIISIICFVVSFLALRVRFLPPNQNPGPIRTFYNIHVELRMATVLLIAGITLSFIHSIKFGLIGTGLYFTLYNWSLPDAALGSLLLTNLVLRLVSALFLIVGVVLYFVDSMATGLLVLGIIFFLWLCTKFLVHT